MILKFGQPKEHPVSIPKFLSLGGVKRPVLEQLQKEGWLRKTGSNRKLLYSRFLILLPQKCLANMPDK